MKIHDGLFAAPTWGSLATEGVPPMNYPQLRSDMKIFHVAAGCDRRRADRRLSAPSA